MHTATMAKLITRCQSRIEKSEFYVATLKRVHLDVYDVVHLDFYTLLDVPVTTNYFYCVIVQLTQGVKV